MMASNTSMASLWHDPARNDRAVPDRLCRKCGAIFGCIRKLRSPTSPLSSKNAVSRWHDANDVEEAVHPRHQNITPNFMQVFEFYSTDEEVRNSALAGCHLCILLVNGAEYHFSAAPFRSRNKAFFLAYRCSSYHDPSSFGALLLCVTDPNNHDSAVHPRGYECLSVLRLEPKDCQHQTSIVPPISLQTLSLSTASDSMLSLAEIWIKECYDTHPECKAVTEGLHEGPTRLLDLGSHRTRITPRLVVVDPQKDLVPYVALSYCWGVPSGDVLKLTAATLVALTRGVDISSFPRTIQDAIYICRKLGYRFLRVDSVCIMQDDPKVWRYEASKMGSIYQGCKFSIAAVDAESSSGGCFVTRRPLKTLPLQFPPRSETLDDPNIFRVRRPDKDGWLLLYEDQIHDGKLRCRGWAFQELFLAPRTLQFGKYGIYWECRRIRRNDLCPDGMPEVGYVEWLSGTRRPGPHFKALPFELGLFKPRTMLKEDLDRFSAAWEGITQLYSSLELTYISDRLVAIAGIAELIQSAHRFRYSAGLWLHDFPEQLLWYCTAGEFTHGSKSRDPKRCPEYIAPSFSWASVLGKVQYTPRASYNPQDSKPKHGPTFVAAILEVNIETIDESQSSAKIKDGYLIVRGPVQRVRNSPRGTRRTKDLKFPVHTIRIDCREDADAVFEEILFLFFMRWSTRDIGHSRAPREPDERQENIRGILLVPVEGENNTFRRIGFFEDVLRPESLQTSILAGGGREETLKII
ncbi:HET-domain-containing protein [Hyaloscypha variabilis F]|uniref:HET-domain-containing protein n=1 Tax=Hyaloscypha variabilis (strain UAMH 11265 / GT02V1 / F) TaxID=1149755 RepID=A0A2J6QSY2_HYAVF|nr:HET-domain-containing protein [Hyaloscypha variabilis F]